jgi:pyridoxal phosphate-dependent aminotransferase EpsN
MKRIYLSSPHMSGLEQPYVEDAFATNWIAPLGPHVDAFEQEFAAAVGSRHAATLPRSAPARLRCTWRCCWPASDQATRCSSPH